MSYKILVIGAGGSKGLSGVHENLFQALSKRHELIDILDSRLIGFWKYYNYLYCFLRFPDSSKYIHPIRTVLSKEFNSYRMRTKYYVLKRTELVENKLKKYNGYDLILQTTPIPIIRNKPQKPRYIFIDFTMKLSEKEYPQWESFLSQNDKKNWLKWETQSYQNATGIFTASNHTRDSVINDYNVDPEKVKAVFEGVNLNQLPEVNKDYSNKIILFVGLEFDRKGGQPLLKAFKEVREKTGAELVIVGANPSVTQDGVEVKGFVSREELLDLYQNSSIFAMPSACEPFGIVFLEAMAYKMPCIGSTADAMPEIIKEGETGYLVPPNDHKKLVDRLIQLLEDESLMKSMGEKGRERVEKYFTWDLVVDRMTEQFEKDLNW